MEHLTPVVRVLALVFPIAGLATVPESLLQRDLRFRFLANREIVAYAVGYGVVSASGWPCSAGASGRWRWPSSPRCWFAR